MSLLAAVSRERRLLLVLEDIDRVSRRLASLLERLARHAEDVEIAVAVTARPEGISAKGMLSLRACLKDNLCEVAVEPLARSESELLSSYLSLDREHRIHAEKRAGGHPGFLEEFCKYASSKGIPSRVRQVLSSMILKLPPETKRIAEVLSLFDEPTTWEVIANVSAMPEADLRWVIGDLVRVGLADREKLSIRYSDGRPLLHSRIPRGKRTELHARAFRCLRAAGCKDSILANHAYEGALFSVASDLYRRLANRSFAEKDFTNAGRYFGLVSDCCEKDPTLGPLGPADSIQLARCYGYQGDKARARAILETLLGSREACEDSELLSSVFSNLASPLIEDSPGERVRLLNLAINSLSKNSQKLVRAHASLATALLSMGRLVDAVSALDQVASYGFSRDQLQELEGTRGTVLLSLGDFREAARCLSSKPALWASPGSSSNNLAVSLEQLGDIEQARELQKAALHESAVSGSAIVQIVCLTNLGAMETKLGNIGSAESFFAGARVKIRALQGTRDATGIVSLPSSFADMATLAIQKGEYRDAMVYLANINVRSAGHFFPLELFLVAMTRCELNLELGRSEATQTALDETRHLPVMGDYFEVERLLVEERLQQSSPELCSRLEEALNTSERLGTLYQSCRIRIALARHLIALGNQGRAAGLAQTARGIAAKNGYKPLAAKALLYFGLSTVGEERESALKGSIEGAAQLGFSPLIAEASFRLGASRFSRGDYAGAQDHLSKSISITAQLADDLNGADRKIYLSKANHREARVLFNETLTKIRAFPSRGAELLDRESNLFAKLYRLAAAMTAAPDVGAATATLVQALKETMSHSIVVVTGIGAQMSYHAIRCTLSDEARKRISAVASSAANKPYIAGDGLGGKHGTVIWMPILSLALTGGIYVENVPGESFFSERDIEFLTIVAAISGTELDHVSRKALVPTSASLVDQHGIVGTSKQIQQVRARIEIAGRNAATVLIEGESGTGKELVAKAIHHQSSRAKGPFIPIDCGALPEGLIEAELFGAKKGAYTGAVSDRQGLFEAANQGTIFLDEISNLGIAAQAKFLRVLQEREIRKIGSMTGRTIDVRLIAATNCNLERLVRNGKFRQDLLYRLKVLHILLPPLRRTQGRHTSSCHDFS